jgi:large subunit ribosomal protein L5
MSEQQLAQQKQDNPMREVSIEKVILSCGGVDKELEKAKALLEYLVPGRKPQVIASTKRIPAFNVRPGLEVGTRVTLRGAAAVELLKKLLGGIDNTLKEKQIAENHLSFGLKEYIEIPGVEYQREIGIRGFNVTVVFARKGVRVVRKKIGRGKLAHKQMVSVEEIMDYLKGNFGTHILPRRKKQDDGE